MLFNIFLQQYNILSMLFFVHTDIKIMTFEYCMFVHTDHNNYTFWRDGDSVYTDLTIIRGCARECHNSNRSLFEMS